METMFHISLPCQNLDETMGFYQGILGSSIGRESHRWFDINFFGHQVTFIESESDFDYDNYRFESASIPAFHFGIIVDQDHWDLLVQKLGITNNIEIINFLEGKIGEHRSFFLKDPNGYTIEFKNFDNPEDAFSKN